MGETRVDLLRLLQDLRDAYPGSLEETILTELVANALDSGARQIHVLAEPAARALTVVDDGKGMSRRSLSRFHDLAVTGKARGRTIGFAGVGVKLGLLVSDEVVTETRTPNRKSALATSWRLASHTRAPWRWIEPPGLLDDVGTAVRLYLENPLSPLLETGFLEGTILAHFQPLFDADLAGFLATQYPDGVRFHVNGRHVARASPQPGRAPIHIKVGRQRKPSGVGFLTRDAGLAPDEAGIAVSTLGKVIKHGWDWLGLAPGESPDVAGVVEVPALAECLTLNKGDFIRSGPRGRTFLAYRRAIQQAVQTQLEAWGDAPQPSGHRPPRSRSLERDLQSVLADLSGEYPLLEALIERLSGGQRRLPLGGSPAPRGVAPGTKVTGSVGEDDETPPGTRAATPGEGSPPDTTAPDSTLPDDGGGTDESSPGPAGREERQTAPSGAALPGGTRKKRPARYGLHIRFESRVDDHALGRLVESTVWVNDAHPAYRRALASRSEGYHVALTVALALASLTVEPAGVEAFVAEFLALWGNVGRDGTATNR